MPSQYAGASFPDLRLWREGANIIENAARVGADVDDFTAVLVRHARTSRGDSKDHEIATLGVTTSTAADSHSHGQAHGDANGPNTEYDKNRVAEEVAP